MVGTPMPIECVTDLAGCFCCVAPISLRPDATLALYYIILKSAVVCCLQFKHFGIASATSQKLIVRTLLGNRSVFKHEDAVHHTNRGEAVGDQHGHFAF